MCRTVAPRAALATAFLDRRRGVAAVAPVACGVMAREPARRVGAEASSARTQKKRGRDSLDGKTRFRDREGFAAGEASVVVPAPGQQRLQERMKAELEAVRELHRKAVLLCSGAGRSGAATATKADARISAAGARREAQLEPAAKRRKTFPSKPTTTEAARRQIKPVKQVHRAVAAALPERRIEKTKELLEKRRRMEEIARAREKCRQQVLEVERTALPDETVYRRDLEELGIAEFEYVVTRTRSQARLQDLILV